MVGVIGSGFIVLVVMFFVVGIVLVVGLVLIFGIDCFMLEVWVLINFIGNSVVMLVVVKWCKVLDIDWMIVVFNNEILDEVDFFELVFDDVLDIEILYFF